MNSKIFILTIIAVIIIIVLFQISTNFLNLNKFFNKEKEIDLVDVSQQNSLFRVIVHKDDLKYSPEKGVFFPNATISFKSKIDYSKITYDNTDKKTVVIYPTFTETAYSKNGFYDYYGKKCDHSCLTVLIENNFVGDYRASDTGYQILKLLKYPIITDIDVDKNPEILNQYQKIILLHNEYVTKKEFDAITSHPNVIYLYPNSLYAEITVNYVNNTISLIKGHGYPDESIANGFDWQFENTNQYEHNIECNNWEFYNITNGKMLNCYPENFLTISIKLLETIKEI